MAIGGIGSITSSNMSNNMSARQVSSSDLKDQKSKRLQDDITKVQRQMQKISSEEDLTATEKAEEKKKLQQEKSDLSTKLKLHQDELQKSQKREIKLAELQEERNPIQKEDIENKTQTKDASSAATDTADEKPLPAASPQQTLQPGTVITQNSDGTVILKDILNQSTSPAAKTQTEQIEAAKEEAAKKAAEKEEALAEEKKADTENAMTGLTGTEVQAMVSADSTMQQANRQGSLVTQTTDGIAILKSEIKQDAYRGTDTERKETELKDMQNQHKRELAFQFSMLGEANRTAQAASDTGTSANGAAQSNAERTFHVSGVNATAEDIALQQSFQVSIA